MVGKAMVAREDVTEFLVWLGVIGTYIFTWGVSSYQKFRVARRKEDVEDAIALAKLHEEKTK
jgi:hypothetical protein